MESEKWNWLVASQLPSLPSALKESTHLSNLTTHSSQESIICRHSNGISLQGTIISTPNPVAESGVSSCNLLSSTSPSLQFPLHPSFFQVFPFHFLGFLSFFLSLRSFIILVWFHSIFPSPPTFSCLSLCHFSFSWIEYPISDHEFFGFYSKSGRAQWGFYYQELFFSRDPFWSWELLIKIALHFWEFVWISVVMLIKIFYSMVENSLWNSYF